MNSYARTLAALTLVAAPTALAALPSAAHAAEVRRDVVYASPGGTELTLDAYLPDGPGPHPAVIVIHGGGWRSGNKLQLAIHAYAFARAGIAAFSIDYRLAPEHRWPAQIHDCVAAVRWVRTHARELDVDPERIGAFGYSAGGHLAALLGSSDEGAWDEGAGAGKGAGAAGAPPSARVTIVCAGGAPCDFTDLPGGSRTFVFLVGRTPGEARDVYEKLSPVAHASADDPPMLFFHGDADLLVRTDQPRGMVEKLRAAGVEANLIVLPGVGHIAAAVHPRSIRLATRFLVEKLAPAERPEKPRVF